jgi:16S rRNA (guanine527-N7)-methyltransferase
MSRTEAADTRRALDTLAAAWQVPCDPAQTGAIVAYAELLLEWSARINLTAARSVAAIVDGHLPDAFALARRLEAPAHLVDVGSGGGLPAIPLALLRAGLRIDLCEPIAKKGAFLRTAIRELGLAERVRLHAVRVEELTRSHPRQFDAAFSRATFEPTQWRAIGPRLVRPGGRVFALTAADALPDEANREVYLGGRRALVEIAVET